MNDNEFAVVAGLISSGRSVARWLSVVAELPIWTTVSALQRLESRGVVKRVPSVYSKGSAWTVGHLTLKELEEFCTKPQAL